MNNKHQELIDGKIKDIAIRMVNGVENKTDILTQTLQETIDTVLEEERKRVLEALTTTKDTDQMLEGWERYWIEVETDRFVENCIECDNTFRILKALDKTPPNTV